MPEFLRFGEIKKTRKPHICFACGDKIEAGSKAFIWVSVDSGKVRAFHLHEKCGDIVRSECFPCGNCADMDGFYEDFLRESANCGYGCKAVKRYLEPVEPGK
jgi:hypothetical protein